MTEAAQEELRDIALFGLFRSGTNYTRTVMEWNYRCRLVTDVFAWKHGFYPVVVDRSRTEYPDIDVVFVTKNPFSSIASLYSYYTQNGRNIFAAKDWKQFLAGRFVIYDSFQEHSPQYRFANVVEYWNCMNWNYYSIRRPGMTRVHVRYEDMLERPLETAGMAAGTLGLSARFSADSGFRVPQRVTRNMGDRERRKDDDYLTERTFSRDHYESREYLRRFDTADLEFVVSRLDIPLVAELGYRSELDHVLGLLGR